MSFVCNPLVRSMIESCTSAALHFTSWKSSAECFSWPHVVAASKTWRFSHPFRQLGRSSHWRRLFLSDSVHVHVFLHELNLHFWNLPDDLPIFDLGNLEDVHDRTSSILSTSCNSGLVICSCTLLCLVVVELTLLILAHRPDAKLHLHRRSLHRLGLDTLPLVCVHGMGRRCMLSWWLTLLCKRCSRNALRRRDVLTACRTCKKVSFFWIELSQGRS